MQQPDDPARLQHMLDAALKAVQFLQGRNRGDLDTDEQLTLSLTRLLEIIGEAAGKVFARGQQSCPGIPWPQVVGMRNRLIRGYFEVDMDEIWRTVQEDLPPLITILKKAVI